ncbi:MAG: class I SAM-dependent methyltransferase [bacterium]
MNELNTEKINFKDFPEQKLRNRIKLSYKWLDEDIENLLDGGCSYGYGTKYLAEKSDFTFAVDVNPLHIAVAKEKYRNIQFRVAVLEDTGFESSFFDAIVLNDVLEHTTDKIQTLNEMYRILKPGGFIIISTPHRGLFGFLDPYNYGYNLKKYFPWLYKGLYKFVRLVKEGKMPKEFNPEHEQKHEHYSLKDFKSMLSSSSFKDNYTIEKIFRSGLLVEVIVMNLESVLNIFLPQRISRIILKPFSVIAELDYWTPFAMFAYNIAIKIRKMK